MKFIKAGLLKVLSFMGRTLRPTILARSQFLTRAHARLSLWIHGSNEADVGPFHVRFDPRDRTIGKKLALYGTYEEDEITLLCSLVKPGDVVMDVGANFGLYSLYLSRTVGPKGKVIAFEPDPDNFALLCANLKANGCTNVLPFQYALGERAGDVELFQIEDNRGNLSLADLGQTGRSVTVPMRRADEVLDGLGLRPDVAKIDVEGAEPLVISGLGEHKPERILFEFAPEFIRSFNNSPERFLDSFVAAGYALELVDSFHPVRVQLTSSEILARANQFPFRCNIVAVRQKPMAQPMGSESASSLPPLTSAT
jgi:FkbM family methyltransferase